MKTYFLRLLEYVEWADRRVLELLRRSNDPSDEARRWFAHILSAEQIWLQRLQGQASELEAWPDLPLDQCAAISESNMTGMREYLDGLEEHDLETRVKYTTTGGSTFKTAVRDILTHVAFHGAYHRGQIACALRAEGEKPASTDYIMFVRGAG